MSGSAGGGDERTAPVLFMAIRAWLQPLRRLFEELWTTAKRERERRERRGEDRKENKTFHLLTSWGTGSAVSRAIHYWLN